MLLQIKIKLIDWLKNHIFTSPNRIDPHAIIAPHVRIYQSEIHGKISIADHSLLYKVNVSGNISIGKNTSLWGPNIHIQSLFHPVSIGNFCSIAHDVTIQEYNHDHSRITTYFIHKNIFGEDMRNDAVSKGPITIGHDVWIGTGATVLSGVTIGNGVVVAANSVVTRNIPPYAIVGGSPAQIIKYRFDEETILLLQEIQWWNWDHQKIKNNKSIFSEKFPKEKLEEWLR